MKKTHQGRRERGREDYNHVRFSAKLVSVLLTTYLVDEDVRYGGNARYEGFLVDLCRWLGMGVCLCEWEMGG